MHETTVRMIPLALIRREPQARTRMDEESLAAIAESIRQRGVVVPVMVRRVGDEYVVVDGHRRLEGSLRAGLQALPALIHDGEMDPAAVIEMQLITASQREDLGPLDKARAIEQFIHATAWPAARAAAHLQLSEATVSKLLALLRLPKGIQDQVDSGAIGLSVAYELAQVRNATEQRRLADDAATGGLNRKEVSRRAKRRPQPAERSDKAATAPRPPHVTARLGGGRSLRISGPALSIDTLIAWVEELLGKARTAATAGLDLDSFIHALATEARA